MAQNHKTSAFRLGEMVFGLLALFTAVEFGLALFFNYWQVLLLLALVKAGLVLYYYMHVSRLFIDDAQIDRESYLYKLTTNRIGLWLFMISDGFIFTGLMIARISLLGLTRPELNQFLGLVVTAVLLISSFFANRAEAAMEHGQRKQFLTSISVTLGLGILFILGVVGVEWRIAPFGPGEGVAGAVFYTMTGFHAFHVLTGVIFLIIVLRNGLRGRYTTEKHWGVEAAVVYWHFIDVVWIFFYPALYLMGTVK